MIGGGIPSGQVSEIFGPPGCGKTQANVCSVTFLKWAWASHVSHHVRWIFSYAMLSPLLRREESAKLFMLTRLTPFLRSASWIFVEWRFNHELQKRLLATPLDYRCIFFHTYPLERWSPSKQYLVTSCTSRDFRRYGAHSKAGENPWGWFSADSSDRLGVEKNYSRITLGTVARTILLSLGINTSGK